MAVPKSGVYQIYNLVNGKRYIGSSKDLSHRKASHLWELRNGCNKNPNLQADFDECGQDVFEFSVMEYVNDISDLVSTEQRWIDFIHPEYNVNQIAGAYIGDYIRTDEALQKRREKEVGSKKHTDEHKDELRRRWLGDNNPSRKQRFSEERRSKMSELMKGDKNPNYGKPFSSERKQKIGAANAHHYNGFVSPDGVIYRDIHNLSAFCREHDLTISKMALMAKGKRPHHKGWTKLDE